MRPPWFIIGRTAKPSIRRRPVNSALGLMKTASVHIGSALSMALSAWSPCAFSQDTSPAPSYSIKETEPRTGTSIRYAVVTSTLPLNKRYDQLAPEQQAVVRSNYVALHPLDEPPFPADGLGPLFAALQKGATALQADGELVIYVAVDREGRPTTATLVQSPNPRFGEFAASATLLTNFKPGLCKGQPCAMEFPVRLSFSRK